MQRRIGNRATVELLGIGQAKLAVGASNDRYEREADAAAAAAVARFRRGAGNRAGADVDADADVGTDAGTDTAPPVRRVSEIGATGGEVSAETEAGIQRARGGGVPLDRSTRTGMEQAFGADLGAVRLHAGPDAAELNDRVQAKAFTIGSDVFFRDALPDVRTGQGQHLLAHELAHTLQQGAGRNVGRRIQRLAFRGTDWARATRAKVSAGGGIGVLIMNDGDGPLVVKAGESMTSEVVVAATLLSEGTGGGAKGWQASAPDSRAVDPREAKTIHDVAEKLLGDGRREKNVLDDLAAGKGVMVFGFAEGSEVKDLLSESQTKKGRFGKRGLRKDSVSYALVHDPGLLQTLGRGAAVDLALGNVDRLVGSVNFENMMVDVANKKLRFIDNVQMKNESFLRDAKEYQLTGRSSFDAWAQHDSVKKLRDRNFGALASFTLDELANAIFGDKRRGTVGEVDEKDRATVEQAFDAQRQKLHQWLVKGLSDGRANCLASMRDAKGLVRSVPNEFKRAAATNLVARRQFLSGVGANAAWAAADAEVTKLFAWKRATPKGMLAHPPDPGGKGGGDKSGDKAPTTPWKRVTPAGRR